jgi:O-antigen ligase
LFKARPGAIAALLAFVVLGLSIMFRWRERGETGLDLQNGIKLATWAGLVPLAILHYHRLRAVLHAPLTLLAAGYVSVALASVLWSEDPAYTAGNAIGLAAYLALACIAVAILGVRSTLHVAFWALLVLIAAGLLAAVVLPEIAWRLPFMDSNIRLRGLSGHPNVFAQQAGVMLTICVILRRKRAIKRRIFLIGVMVGAVAIALADSRTTGLSVVAAWAAVAARDRGLIPSLGVAALALLTCAVGLVALDSLDNLDALMGEISRSGSAKEILTMTGRTEIWAVSWERIAEKPLLGWGFNGTEALIQSSVSRTFYGAPTNAHNMYIQSLLGLGVLGSIPGFGMLLTLVAWIFKRPNSARDQVTVFLLILGMGEVAIFGIPTLLTLVVFLFIAAEASADSDRRMISASRSGSSEEGV